MPIKDPEKRRAYDRDRKRIGRSGQNPTLSPTVLELPAEYRLAKANDILAILTEQLEEVRNDKEVKSTEQARCVGYLCGVALKAIEASDMAQRIADLERTIKKRKSA